MPKFPHATLNPSEATPRISATLAGQVVEAIDRARSLGILKGVPVSAAICVAVWVSNGAVCKWLVNTSEAEETLWAIDNLLTLRRLQD